MSRRNILTGTLLGLVLMGAALAQSDTSYAAGPSNKPVVRLISRLRTSTFKAAAVGKDGIERPEINKALVAGDLASPRVVNRSQTKSSSGKAPLAKSAPQAPRMLSPITVNGFDGLNHRDQRLANGGNQFSLEPPDQGLCAGNGKIMEPINDVVQVYDTSGVPLLNGGNAVGINPFLGDPAEINRTTGVYGPSPADPSCYYDASTNRWFLVLLTLETKPSNGDLTGKNHLDLAVSTSGDPTGTWVIYRIPVQDDHSQGTPNHFCSRRPDGTGHGPCIGDYPHIGADANGFYITTNEYSFFGPEFHGAQIYAFSKAALAANNAHVTMWQFDTAGVVGGNPGFTVWPAISTAGVYDSSQGGTEYFLSSNAAQEANGTGYSTDLIVWAFIHTSNLPGTAPTLLNKVLTVGAYSFPPNSDQKAGNTPLGTCLNKDECATFLNGETDPFAPEIESIIDSNDTRIQQVVLADGMLWSALDTGVDIGGTTKAGIEWFIVTPSVTASTVNGTITKQDYLALGNNNLTYPAVSATSGGNGIVAYTLVGADFFPSAAFTSLSIIGSGSIITSENGFGPDDGFTSYKYYVGTPPSTRWGDYGAAVELSGFIWVASEYIGQTCTFAEYLVNTVASPVGSCNKTRTSLGNWDTHITEIAP